MNETIKLLREQNNYSQNSIATFLGISRQMYIKYEQGVIAPPVKVVKDLANFYRVPYEYIIDDKLAGTEDKKIILTTDYKDNTINMEFSDNLVDNREKGYILSAAFLAFAANEGLDKQQVIEMINSHYDQFTGDDDSSLFKRL